MRKAMGISTDTPMGRRRPEDAPPQVAGGADRVDPDAPEQQAVVLHNLSPRRMKVCIAV
jgi:hypothetical protein